MKSKKATSSDVVYHNATVTRQRREQIFGHPSTVLWFTGLSGAGKSTLAHAVEEQLYLRRCHSYVFDGDNVRHGLCGDLGFSLEDRQENLRRIAEMCKLVVDAGLIALTAFISPVAKDRQLARMIIGEKDFIEIYCRCDITICEQRDVKGLYEKARAGLIKDFTGISSPYEEPSNPDLVIDTDKTNLHRGIDAVLKLLKKKQIVRM